VSVSLMVYCNIVDMLTQQTAQTRKDSHSTHHRSRHTSVECQSATWVTRLRQLRGAEVDISVVRLSEFPRSVGHGIRSRCPVALTRSVYEGAGADTKVWVQVRARKMDT
jgi:hypothetical protein